MLYTDAMPWLIIAAFSLDLVFGDPVYRLHPVRLIGNGLITPLESWLREKKHDTLGGGLLLLLITLAVSTGIIVLIDWVLSPFVIPAFIFQIFIIYSCLAVKDLQLHVRKVHAALSEGDIDAARAHLATIVGRETASLDEEGIARACVETLAENLSDGIIAPLLYAFIGGAPLVILYKAANTLDSMVGYKNDRFAKIGYFSARFDDLMNWVPARLSFLLLLIAGYVHVRSWRDAWRIALTNRRRHTSPNAGYPEAAMAGILNIRLGGPNRYHGQTVEKPFIHPDGAPVTPGHILMAWRHSFAATVIAMFCFSLIKWGV